ncbi:uncharacterized protein LOC122512880 [Leptopilina heterotoma]|uniref:uncharacterized protein LOC122512880 n=1 Tax=Leptopilina heterotoma TaxID=63436 RepID=UPI001CA8D12C|nr:uncharacterized protein LOC122512880 [Leptopilina heterotoma]
MNTITPNSQLSNFQSLSVCYYITTLGIILNTNNLTTTTVENDTVTVLNALFEYLSKSENETAAKIHLLDKVSKQSELHFNGSLTDIKNVDKFYHHIINAALFASHGNVTNYVTKIFKDNTNLTLSSFKRIVYDDFSKNQIIINCTLRKVSEKLSPISIERIIQDHVLPIFIKMFSNLETKLMNLKEKELKIVKRSKRQPERHNLNHHLQDWFISRMIDTVMHQGAEHISDVDKNLFLLLLASLAIRQHNEPWMIDPIELWLCEPLTNSTIPDQIAQLDEFYGRPVLFNDIKILTTEPGGEMPFPRTRAISYSVHAFKLSHVRSDSQYGFIDLDGYNPDFRNLYLTIPALPFDLINLSQSNEGNKEILHIELKRKRLLLPTWYTYLRHKADSSFKRLLNEFLFDMAGNATNQNTTSVLTSNRNIFTHLLSKIATLQMNQEWMRAPIQLWLCETLTNTEYIEQLANAVHSKGTLFSFNDIKMLTDRYSYDSLFPKIEPNSDPNYIIYNIKSNSQYGFVDLYNYNAAFLNRYITFPDVSFTVIDTSLTHMGNKSIIYIELLRNNLSQHTWSRNMRSKNSDWDTDVSNFLVYLDSEDSDDLAI